MAKKKTNKKNQYRLTEDDIQGAIFIPNKDKDNNNEDKFKSITVFTIIGNHDELTNEVGHPVPSNGYPVMWDTELEDGTIVPAEKSAEAYAKSSVLNGRQRFYIKENSKHQLLNPVGGDPTNSIRTRSHHLKQTGNASFKYREVGRNTFMLYLRFLQSKNTAYLIQAEREAM